MTLLLLVVIPLFAALGVVSRPAKRARSIALLGTLADLALTIVLLLRFDWGRAEAFQFVTIEPIKWLPALGLNLSVGVDSVSLLLIALTALLGPICVLSSYTAITERVKTYYAWLLVLQAAMCGVFMARDLIFFYICFEFTLVPMFILISLYGSTNRRKAATKFFLYTFTGSVIALAGFVYVAWWGVQHTGQPWSFDIESLQLAARSMPASAQAWVLAALLIGFAVKVPLFPLHTWLPLAHTEAPTAGSVILAGVLLKLGTYGLYRFVLTFAPLAIVQYAPAVAILCIIGIIYAGLICWVQRDVKKLVAYSSVSHLGFCILGLMALNVTGMTGSVMYMLNHGLSTGALFLMIGMVYERYHTRNMDELGGLAIKMPIWATFMVFFALASVGLPGLNGFVGEFMCLFGAFQAGAMWGDLPGRAGSGLGFWYAAVAGTGVIITAIYIMYMVGRIVFGPLREPAGHHAHDVLPRDLNAREIGLLLPIAVLCLVIGVYPTPMLKALDAPVHGTIAMIHRAEFRAEQLVAEQIEAEVVMALPERDGDGGVVGGGGDGGGGS